jgi:hypothetical protein
MGKKRSAICKDGATTSLYFKNARISGIMGGDLPMIYIGI